MDIALLVHAKVDGRLTVIVTYGTDNLEEAIRDALKSQQGLEGVFLKKVERSFDYYYEVLHSKGEGTATVEALINNLRLFLAYEPLLDNRVKKSYDHNFLSDSDSDSDSDEEQTPCAALNFCTPGESRLQARIRLFFWFVEYFKLLTEVKAQIKKGCSYHNDSYWIYKFAMPIEYEELQTKAMQLRAMGNKSIILSDLGLQEENLSCQADGRDIEIYNIQGCFRVWITDSRASFFAGCLSPRFSSRFWNGTGPAITFHDGTSVIATMLSCSTNKPRRRYVGYSFMKPPEYCMDVRAWKETDFLSWHPSVQRAVFVVCFDDDVKKEMRELLVDTYSAVNRAARMSDLNPIDLSYAIRGGTYRDFAA